MLEKKPRHTKYLRKFLEWNTLMKEAISIATLAALLQAVIMLESIFIKLAIEKQK